MIASIFGLAIAMILAFAAALGGVMQIAIGRNPVTGWVLLLLGLPLAVLCLIRIIRLNRRYQDEHLAAVLKNPAEIVARWRVGDDELILAQRGLFIGRAFLPFAAAYQRLSALVIAPDERSMTMVYRNIGAEDARTREVAITPQVVPAIREFIAGLEQRSAGQS